MKHVFSNKYFKYCTLKKVKTIFKNMIHLPEIFHFEIEIFRDFNKIACKFCKMPRASIQKFVKLRKMRQMGKKIPMRRIFIRKYIYTYSCPFFKLLMTTEN